MLNNIQIEYLADHSELVPILANWSYQEWRSYDPSLTIEKALINFKLKLNHNKIPLTLVAIENTDPIGMVSLKPTITPEGYADKCPWIGSIYIIPGKRGIGLGKQLMTEIEKIALKLGYSELFLYTSIPNARDWYLHLGWKIIKTDIYQNHQITIMHYIIKQN